MLREMPSAQAVGWKLLAGEMNQPDVAVELLLLAQFQKNRRSQHESGGRGVIVVGSGGREPSPLAARIRLIVVRHVCRVVVVGHDYSPAAVATGNDDDQVALVAVLLLVFHP